MKGMDADAPSKPFGGPEEFTFAPDGKAVVFSARDAGREEAWSTNLDFYVAPVDGVGDAAQPDRGEQGDRSRGPVFSPDGKTLAYRAMTRPGYESDQVHRIMLRAWPDVRSDRVLADDWDRSPRRSLWSRRRPDALHHRRRTSASTRSSPSTCRRARSGRSLNGGHIASPAARGRSTGRSPLDHFKLPAELHTVKPDGSGLRRHHQRQRASAWRGSVGEPSSSPSRAGTTRRSTPTSSSRWTSTRRRSIPSRF